MERFMKICLLLAFLCPSALECKKHDADTKPTKQQIQYSGLSCRKKIAFLNDYGAKGDGKTSNTDAFKAAVADLSKYGSKGGGGAMLVVPPGKWLTGSFNLTSYFTLYIHHDAVLLASQDEKDYPLIDPLPSYGRGRDAAGQRFASLIFGTNLTDVVITGGNGTIDGQGQTWWTKFRHKKLKNTRPYLVEIMYSTKVVITNLTLIDAPTWNVHPVYSSNIIIESLTISAPYTSPNTDGINPDSCSNIRIRDSYIMSGDDCIAVKSGWDEYGIKFGMPTQHLSIKRLTCISPYSAVIALGSEMSGGIRDVRAEQIYAFSSESGVRIKTAPGRGAYVKDIYVRGMEMHTMKYVVRMAGNYNQHPDSNYDPNALPLINNINIRDVYADGVKTVGNLLGIASDTFTKLCFSNVTAELAKKNNSSVYDWPEYGVDMDMDMDMDKDNKDKEKKKKKAKGWKCADIEGVSKDVTPEPCDLLPGTKNSCDFPTDTLAIDTVQLKTCSANY
ncbi:Pectin lyase-like superfamily protein [Striga hermonthica]|uniref:Pectin lyase-like superfamily protein n=1 Tax=Striga hermonthica TaxID=68872 RepID=A0A9N7MPJ4_STRHE|nr:Pectin lyase-like superfamily protein [Striga hermonthica]